MPNGLFCSISRAGYERTVAFAVLSGSHEDLQQMAQRAEDSAHYSKPEAIVLVGFESTACRGGDRSTLQLFEIGLVGFEPTASWSRTRRSTKLSHSPK